VSAAELKHPGSLALRRLHVLYAAVAVHVPEGALPELTHAGGGFCAASCAVQAWSGATLLDALHDAHALEDADADADADAGRGEAAGVQAL
jgi:hypothetical protein